MITMAPTDFYAAFGIVPGTATTTAESTPHAAVGDLVYIRSLYTIAAGQQAKIEDIKKFKVVAIPLFTANFSGASKFLAKDKVSASTCAAAPVDPDATTPGNLTTPYWYQLQDSTNGNVRADYVHQSDILDLATLKTYLGLQQANLA